MVVFPPPLPPASTLLGTFQAVVSPHTHPFPLVNRLSSPPSKLFLKNNFKKLIFQFF